MTNTNKLFEIFNAAFCDGVLDEELKNSITEQELPELFKIAKKHDLAHIVGDVLDKNGLLPENSQAKKVFLQERNMAIFRYEQINYELKEITRVLNENKIEHIPLKGSVIRALYPEPWLRTSCDIDILVHIEDVGRASEVLQKELAYEYTGKCSHDEQFFSPSGVHLELHFTLFEDYLGTKTADVLQEVWVHTYAKEEGKSTLVMTNEMFYFYHFAHMAKHFEGGGCGIKPFMDLFVMEKTMPTNERARNELLEKGGLLAFANRVCELSKVWFENAEHNASTQVLEEFVLLGGVYGTLENKVVAQQSKQGGKFRYMISRVFQPYEQLKYGYPIIQKHKWLTPVYQVVRWFRVLFKGRAKTSMKELNTNANVTKETQNKTQKLLQDLGLI